MANLTQALAININTIKVKSTMSLEVTVNLNMLQSNRYDIQVATLPIQEDWLYNFNQQLLLLTSGLS